MAPLPYLSFTEDDIFTSFYGALVAWVFLILAPKWRGTHVIAALSSFVYSLLYIGLLVGLIQKKGSLNFGAMGTLGGVHSLLADKDTTLLAWCHYVAFDQMAALWIAQNSVKAKVNGLLVAPCFILTLFVGPSGLVAYFVVRTLFGGAARASGQKKTQ